MRCDPGYRQLAQQTVSETRDDQAMNMGCALTYLQVLDACANVCAGADAAGLHRGDILATMPDGRLLALDAVVTHSGATSYADGASKTNGHAAAGSARAKRTAFASNSEGVGEYDIRPTLGGVRQARRRGGHEVPVGAAGHRGGEQLLN